MRHFVDMWRHTFARVKCPLSVVDNGCTVNYIPAKLCMQRYCRVLEHIRETDPRNTCSIHVTDLLSVNQERS